MGVRIWCEWRIPWFGHAGRRRDTRAVGRQDRFHRPALLRQRWLRRPVRFLLRLAAPGATSWTRPWPGRKAIWTRTPASASPGTSNTAPVSAPTVKPKCCSAPRTRRSRACSAPGWSWAGRARSGSGAATSWIRTGTRRRIGASPIGRARRGIRLNHPPADPGGSRPSRICSARRAPARVRRR